ncbi:MAG TPA: hypothetical protein EYQ18_22445 [Candidatus Handelsmanbacteria bacterium]|nr:hypothetical protein [Candidatus Handelsmanbacteria bacterium]
MARVSDAQLEQWKQEGYVVVEGALQGDDLRRLQAAFDRCAAQDKAAWLDELALGTQSGAFFDIQQPLERDRVFAALADHPSYVDLLMDFLGEDHVFQGIQIRTLPPSPVSYVGWHPDYAPDTPQHIKLQIYVEDVPADGGAFAFVPGSHKPDAGPYPVYDDLEDMPGHLVFSGAAGTAILFDNHGWHTSMVNTTSLPRKSIILSYGVRQPTA